MKVYAEATFRIASLLLLILALVGGSIFTIMPSAYADPPDDSSDYLFYEVASKNAAELETGGRCGSYRRSHGVVGAALGATADKKDDSEPTPCESELGTVGAYVAFIDDTIHESPHSIFIPNAHNSQDINYAGRDVLDKNDGVDRLLQRYLAFGSTLNALGLDEISTTGGLDGTDAERKGLGFAVYALYTVASGVDAFFEKILGFFASYDPLRFVFGDGIDTGDWRSVDGPEGATAGRSGTSGALSAVMREKVGLLTPLGWFITLVIFVFMLVSALLKGRGVGQAVKNFLLRAGFLSIALVFFSSVYSFGANLIQEYAKQEELSYGTCVVSRHFLDFEKWAYEYRLAIPTGARIHYDKAENVPTEGALTHVQETTLSINRMINDYKDSVCGVGSEGKFYGSRETQSDNEKKVKDLLRRYMSGQTVSPADYNAYVMSRVGPDGLDEKTLIDPGEDKTTYLSAAGVSARSSIIIFRSTSDEPVGNEAGLANMSILAMYNYLSTDFQESKATVYSTLRSSSQFVKLQHYSVVATGDRGLAVFELLLVALQLGVPILLGLGYVLMLIIAGVKRVGSMVASAPLAFLGSLKGMGQFIGAVLGLLAEFVISIFMFIVVERVAYDVISDIQYAFITDDIYYSGNQYSRYVLGLVVSAIVLILFLVVGFKVRGLVVQSIDQGFDETFKRLIGVSAGTAASAGRPSAIGGMAKSLAMYKAMDIMRGNHPQNGNGTGDSGGSSVDGASVADGSFDAGGGEDAFTAGAFLQSAAIDSAGSVMASDVSIGEGAVSAGGDDAVQALSSTDTEDIRSQAAAIRGAFEENGSFAGIGNMSSPQSDDSEGLHGFASTSPQVGMTSGSVRSVSGDSASVPAHVTSATSAAPTHHVSASAPATVSAPTVAPAGSAAVPPPQQAPQATPQATPQAPRPGKHSLPKAPPSHTPLFRLRKDNDD